MASVMRIKDRLPGLYFSPPGAMLFSSSILVHLDILYLVNWEQCSHAFGRKCFRMLFFVVSGTLHMVLLKHGCLNSLIISKLLWELLAF